MLILAILGPLATLVGVGCGLWFFFVNEGTKRRALTIDIWKVWISKDYRKFRVDASRAIKEEKKKTPKGKTPLLAKVVANPEHDIAIGSIEHFLFEVASIKRKQLLDQGLFLALFQETFSEWQELLAGFDRTGTDAFSINQLDEAFAALNYVEPNFTIKFPHFRMSRRVV